MQTLAQHFSRLLAEPQLVSDLRAAVLQQRDKLTWAAAAARLEACYTEAQAALA